LLTPSQINLLHPAKIQSEAPLERRAETRPILVEIHAQRHTLHYERMYRVLRIAARRERICRIGGPAAAPHK
jgi:hypothetical protein